VKNNKNRWTPEILEKLRNGDNVSQLAKELGVSRQRVHAKRKSLGMAPIKVIEKRRVEKAMPEIEKNLGVVADYIIARENSIQHHVVKQLRQSRCINKAPIKRTSKIWTEECISLLGNITDAELAIKMNIASAHVAQMRNKLGIPVLRADRKKSLRHKWSKKDSRLVGTMSDRDLALKLGVSVQRVAARRRKLGLAPYQVKKHT
jgi:Zn-dependent peptidase ImmA (M78 family)